MTRRYPRSTLFPYTTLFRSPGGGTYFFPSTASFTLFARRNLHTRLAGILIGSPVRSEEHTSELQSRRDLVCRLLLEKKKGPGRATQGSARLRTVTPQTYTMV